MRTGRKKADLPFFVERENGKGYTFVPLYLAENIMKDYHFATHEISDEIFYYKDGIYIENGKKIIREEAQRRLERFAKNNYITETEGAIKRLNYIPANKFDNPEDHIVVQNGMLNVKTRELKEWSPEHVHLIKINAKYNPDADCPKVKKFVGEVVDKDNVKLIQEMFGYCLLKDYPFAKAFMLLGAGANGKSTLLDLLEEFLGKDNIANPSLQEILANRFAKIKLYGKLANINADIPSEKLTNVGTFKMLTGGDTIMAEKKFQDPIKFKNKAKLIYAANELPRTTDRTKAFFRRWIVIDFPNRFDEDDADTDEDLPYSILTENEMSGVLNWALDGLDRILKNGGFSMTKSRKDIEDLWVMQTDSLRSFVELHVEQTKDTFITKEDFYAIYTAFCEDKNIYTVKKGQVTKRLQSLLPRVQQFRPEIEVDGEKVRKRAWKYIKVSPELVENLKSKDHVHNVQPFSTLCRISKNSIYNNNSQNTLDETDAKETKVLKDYLKKNEPQGKNISSGNKPKKTDLEGSETGMIEEKKQEDKQPQPQNISSGEVQNLRSIVEIEGEIKAIVKEAKKEGFSEQVIEEIMDHLLKSGQIYEPKPGFYRVT